MVRNSLCSLTVGAVLLLPMAAAARQDEESRPARTTPSKFSLHGYLSVAYADTDEHQLIGIPEEGTADFRNVALQLRYDITRRDAVVVQLGHEHVGRSKSNEIRDNVEVDSAFYQHRFDVGTYVKLGRILTPIGIYNEIRDVGTLLPFFNPPFTIYTEGQFANEYIDGLLVGHAFRRQRPWRLAFDVYTGSWTSFETSSLGTNRQIKETEIDNALGAQLWLTTPVRGLRVGASALRFDVSKGIFRAKPTDRWKAAFLSLDWDTERYLLRAEAVRREQPIGLQSAFQITLPDLEADAFYFQLGRRFGERWSIYGQYERGDVALALPFLPEPERTFWADRALSVHYAFRPNIVLRAEIHDNESLLIEDMPINLFLSPPAAVTYGLLSVSFAF